MTTKITLVMVSSIDGIVSLQDGSSVGTWTSKEDKRRLRKEIQSADAIIVGRRSFRENFLEITKAPIYVLTNNKKLLENRDDRVRYTNMAPQKLKALLNKNNYKSVLLLGGVATNTKFLLRGLIDDIKLTIEPKFFGTGLHFVDCVKTHVKLKLVSVERVNSQGTLFMHYIVKNNKELSNNYVNNAEKVQVDLSVALETNRNWWNERAPKHYVSQYYNINAFLAGQNRIFDYERQELGDIKNKKILHLQCHIGVETLSLARLGANVTGIDFSLTALQCAKDLADKAGTKARFIEANVYDVPEILNGEKFDIVYVDFGSIHWLHDINKWAEIVAKVLKPGGFLYMNEFHPVSMMLSNDSPTFIRDYFYNKCKRWEGVGSYADGCEDSKNNIEYGWEHSLGDVISALTNAGLHIAFVHERPGHIEKQFGYLEQHEDGFWYPREGIPAVPATFSLKAIL